MSLPVWIVVAAAENGIIGASGDMPWRLSTDLKRFKAITMGKPVVMGRKTFESIGRALPGRINIVVTRDRNWQRDDVLVAHDLATALTLANGHALASGAEAVCVIGGGEIYAQALDHADVVHLTRVHARPDGDTRFPDLPDSDWQLDSEEPVPAGDKDTSATTYRVFRRIGGPRVN